MTPDEAIAIVGHSSCIRRVYEKQYTEVGEVLMDEVRRLRKEVQHHEERSLPRTGDGQGPVPRVALHEWIRTYRKRCNRLIEFLRSAHAEKNLPKKIQDIVNDMRDDI